MIHFPLHRQAACGLAFFLASIGAACAGSFQVSPINPTLSARQPVAALTVRNTGTTAAVIQVQAMAWSQPGGVDQYAAAPDVLATPPIFTVPAGGSQVIRVGSRLAPDAAIERAYRLYLREVPPPPKPGFQGLQMALRIDLPLFVQAATPGAARLQWQATRDAAGRLLIHVTNAGQAHAHLSGFQLTVADGAKPLPIPKAPIYVLPGATHDWPVDAPVASGSTVRLVAHDDTREVRVDLVVTAP